MTIKFQAKTKQGWIVDSPIRPFSFPDGQAFVKVDEGADLDAYQYHIADLRGFEPQDLFILSMWAQLLDGAQQDRAKYVVLLPYLPGARSDRGTPNLWSYTQFLASLVSPDQIITIDPHSPAWARSYDELQFVNRPLTVFPFERIIKDKIQRAEDDEHQPYVGVIAPDAGAVDRATRAARVMGVQLYHAEKKRDEATGQLSGFHMVDELPAKGKLLIVDDICDGGGTFVGLAQATGLTHSRLDLWVTHGIFSKGFSQLEDHFGTIHTTNSYYGTDRAATQSASLMDSTLKVHDITSYLYSEIDL